MLSLSIQSASLITTLALCVSAVPSAQAIHQAIGVTKGFKPSFGGFPEVLDVKVAEPHNTLGSRDNHDAVQPFNGTLPSEDHHPTLDKRLHGPDNRYYFYPANTYPFRAVGKLYSSKGQWCTAALVGPRQILTARHCAPANTKFSFYPSWDNGPNPTFTFSAVVAVAFPQYSSPSAACNFQEDYAVMVLDKRFGDGLGWFGVGIPSTSRFDQAIFTSIGYPEDRDDRPYRQDGITLPRGGASAGADPLYRQLGCSATGHLISDQDAAGGQSGSPLWVDLATLWGVLGGTVNYLGKNVDYTRLASGQSMQDWVATVKKYNGDA